MRFFSLSIFMVLLCFMATEAFAQRSNRFKPPPDQTAAQKTQKAKEIYENLPEVDKMRLIDETQEVFDYCDRKDLFSSFHDCSCVASNFFEERILAKPDPSLNIIAIADQVSSGCVNVPGVAGYAYDKCYASYTPVMKYGHEEFCTCYANEYARLYEKDPRAYVPNMAGIGANAIATCDAKGLPSPLHPNGH